MTSILSWVAIDHMYLFKTNLNLILSKKKKLNNLKFHIEIYSLNESKDRIFYNYLSLRKSFLSTSNDVLLLKDFFFLFNDHKNF